MLDDLRVGWAREERMEQLTTGMGWRPLLEGAEAAHALEAVGAIAGALGDPERTEVPGPSLASGRAGIALFFAYLAEHDEAHAETALAWLERALEEGTRDPRDPSLHGGLAGVAWVTQHLGGRLLDEADVEEICAPVDRLLLGVVSTSPWTLSYDLIAGLVGLGVYFLERGSAAAHEGLEQVVARLGELAQRSDAGVTWHTPPEQLPPWQRQLAPDGYCNLGVSHGVPGVIGLLAELCARGIADGAARPLLESAVRWLLAQRQPPGAGSAFGNWVPQVPAPSRVAWCYGDLGLATVLALAARRVEVPVWAELALEVARGVAARPSDETGVADAGLCHGASGDGHLFNRLAQLGDDAALVGAARFWLARTLELRRPGEGLAGYQVWGDRSDGGAPRWTTQAGFLNGVAGIGLALLAAASAQAPEWDRVLLISTGAGAR